MINLEQQFLQGLRQKLELLRQVQVHLEEKTVILMTNQLVHLEKSLQIDAELQEVILMQDKDLWEKRGKLATFWGLEPDLLDWKIIFMRLPRQEAAEIEEIRTAINQVIENIHSINLKNMALIKSGQMYVETLLNAIWPSPTYDREKTGCFTPPTRFSMEC